MENISNFWDFCDSRNFYVFTEKQHLIDQLYFVHLKVVQRHLATKHQIQREQSPSIPYVEPSRRTIKFEPLIQDPNKLHHAINRNFYSPPWLNQVNHVDYNYNTQLKIQIVIPVECLNP